VAGRLVLIDIGADYQVTQIFPNKFEKNAAGTGRVAAGASVIVPNEAHGTLGFEAAPPLGTGRLLALAVPDSFPIEATIGSEEVRLASKSLRTVPKPASYVMNVVDQVIAARAKSPEGDASSQWAYGVLEYEIVP
jgi:hypothetical protein